MTVRSGRATLIIGGARSGKSELAERMAIAEQASSGCGVTYIATADARDAEMAARIAMHRSRRPERWETAEGSGAEIARVIASRGGVLLLDCLTMYLSREFFRTVPSPAEVMDEDEWREHEAALLSGVGSIFDSVPDGAHLIAVTNEIGLGIVPETRLSRRFRDAQGRVNRIAASRADRVVMMVAGIPVWIKGSEAGAPTGSS